MALSKTPLDLVTCASLPASGLGVLAALRRMEGVSVLMDGDRAWAWWGPGDGRVLRAVLPVVGVELFEGRGGEWFRQGRRLPAAGVPDRSGAVPIARAVLPAPFEAVAPAGEGSGPVRLRLVRGGRSRAASALVGSLAAVGRWADLAPTKDLGAIRGAISGDRVLLVGEELPALAGAERYWGRSVLVPLGFECRPDVGEGVLLDALGAEGGVILRVFGGPGGGGEAEVEAIPLAALEPLTRAGVRLAGGPWPR